MFQYTFPPACVGEVGRIGAPSRREIGHGMLAERALEPILPSDDDFPYTVRVESTITESNGSSRSEAKKNVLVNSTIRMHSSLLKTSLDICFEFFCAKNLFFT